MRSVLFVDFENARVFVVGGGKNFRRFAGKENAGVGATTIDESADDDHERKKVLGGGRGGDGDVFDDVMERTGGAEFAGDEIEGVDAEGRAFEGGVGAKPFGDGGRGVGRAAGEGDVRVERADVEIEAEVEEGFVDLLAELVETRVAVAESDPENARRSAFGGKGADAFDGKEERLHLDGRETFDNGREKGVVHVTEETEGDVELVLRGPAGAGQEGGAESGDDDLDGLGEGKGDEKALGGHTGRGAIGRRGGSKLAETEALANGARC